MPSYGKYAITGTRMPKMVLRLVTKKDYFVE
jgi:hypothetical protein